MKEYILDTNVVLRFLLKDVPSQLNQIRSVFQEAKIGKVSVTIPEIVFLELEFALEQEYKFSKETVGKILFDLTQIPYVKVEKRDVILSALLLFQSHSVSFVDLLIYSEASATGKELLTFDKKLQKLSKRN